MEQNMKDLKDRIRATSDGLDSTVAAFIDTAMENDDIETLKTMSANISTVLNSITDRRRISRISNIVAFASIIVTLCYSATYGLIIALANIMGTAAAYAVISHDKHKALEALNDIGFPVREFIKDIGL